MTLRKALDELMDAKPRDSSELRKFDALQECIIKKISPKLDTWRDFSCGEQTYRIFQQRIHPIRDFTLILDPEMEI